MHASSLRENYPFPWRWLVALAPLVMLVHEAHEFAHTLTGRLVCGRWAERDFSRWSIEGCDSWLPTAAGPLLSYLLMAAGALLALRRGRAWPGVALVFAANPLARLVTALSGHGDEMLVARALVGADAGWVHPAAAGVVAGLCALALAVAWRALAATAWRRTVFLLALVAGIVITGPLLPLFNRMLDAGFLAGPVAGAPWLVHWVTLASAVGALLGLRWLRRPVEPESLSRPASGTPGPGPAGCR
ncbi:hypothetical protein ACFWZU_10000 [Frateuria sp. GZRR33]|uniref:hypothetical protein n=1 Tax=Frateuria sp. GZRR33 TaxID=3351535 RepID=UPI003EDBB26A